MTDELCRVSSEELKHDTDNMHRAYDYDHMARVVINNFAKFSEVYPGVGEMTRIAMFDAAQNFHDPRIANNDLADSIYDDIYVFVGGEI